MNWIVVLIALLLAAGGGYAVFLGADINQVEHGWAHLIAGSVLVSASALLLAIVVVLFKLDGLRQALNGLAPSLGAPEGFAPPASYSGGGTRSMPSAPKPLRSGPVSAVPMAAAGAIGLAAVAAGAATLSLRKPEEAEASNDASRQLESLPPEYREQPETLPAEPPVAAVSDQLAAEAETAAEPQAEVEAESQPEPESHETSEAIEPEALDPLEGDWLDRALSGDVETLAPLAPAPVPVETSSEPDAIKAAEPPESDALESEVAREMAYGREPANYPADPPPVSEAEPAHAAPAREIIGRHQVAGISYLMYADGSIDADDGTQVRHFSSIADLKAHFAPV